MLSLDCFAAHIQAYPYLYTLKKNFVKMLGNIFPKIHIKKLFLILRKKLLRDTK